MSDIKRGQVAWYPKSLIEEIENIRLEKNIVKRSDATRELIRYAHLGKEVEKLSKITRLDFNIFKRRRD